MGGRPGLRLVRRCRSASIGPPGSLGLAGAGLTPAGWAGHVVPMVRCRPIGLRFTSAAAQLAWRRALSLPMYRLLRAP